MHCRKPPWQACDCKVVLHRFKHFGDFICVLPAKQEPRELVNA